MDSNNLKIWLPFDNSPTLDKCGNSWTTSGNPSLSATNAISKNALQLSGGAYLRSDNKILIGGQDFTVDFWAYANSSQVSYAGFFAFTQAYNSENGSLLFSRNSSNNNLVCWLCNANSSSKLGSATFGNNFSGTRHHYEIDYLNSQRQVLVFVDGNLTATINLSAEYPRLERYIYIGRTAWGASQYFQGTIDEFRIYDGVALHTANFTPPSAADYDLLEFEFGVDFDTCRKLSANVQIDFDTLRKVKQLWRYENFGTADLLSVQGYTVQNDGAIYKSAFYQTSLNKCFDIPATEEIWAKFDVYSGNYRYRWRAYNGNSSGTPNGISSYGTKIDFWSSENSSREIFETSNLLSVGILQTVLLHMVSGSSGGVIEAWLDGVLIYSYTGNVNNGSDFQNFFLQSDGAATTFSNVIISNSQITFNENVIVDFDCTFDLLRRVVVPFDFADNFDVQRFIVHGFDNYFDTSRNVIATIDFHADTFRQVQRTLNLNCDALRQIPHKVIIAPADNLLPIDTPQTEGIQSISISITAGQLVDRLSVVTVNNIDILHAVQGQVLDYVYNYRVESFSKRGILSTCQCCSNLDNLLYAQIAYKLQKQNWNGGTYVKQKNSDDSSTPRPGQTIITYRDETEIEKPTVAASAHVQATASRLGLIPVMFFDNFQSTVEIEQEGVTYQDIISEVFNWSSRVPHKLINIFIRNNFLFVVQRGCEPHTFDLSAADIGKDITIQRQLVRTSFGVTRKTTADLARNNGGRNWHWEPVLGNELPEDEQQDDEEEEEEEEEEEDTTPARNLPRSVHTYEDGVATDIYYQYDDDGNLTKTETIVTSDSFSSKVVVENTYTTRNGEKLLKMEQTLEYEWANGNWQIVNRKTINHEYTTVGQQHVSSVSDDGSINGSLTTSARRNDKPTPFNDKMNQQQNKNDPHYIVEDNGQLFIGNGWGVYTYVDGRKIEIVGYQQVFDDDDIETGTLEEVQLYDSSFPVDDAKARSITSALRWLNRKIQETVTLDVYNFNHVFDLRDKIIFQGNTYHLQSNNFTKNPNIVNQQSLELIRWY